MDVNLGYLHSLQFAKPSLVLDFMEAFRPIIDNFTFGYCLTSVRKSDATYKDQTIAGKKGRRQFLSDDQTKIFLEQLDAYFNSKIEIPRIKHGKTQTLSTLISEEALLLGRYLCSEIPEWSPAFPTSTN